MHLVYTGSLTKVAGTEVESGKSGYSTTHAMSSDREEETGILDGLLSSCEVVRGLLGEHIEIVDTLCDFAAGAVGYETFNADWCAIKLIQRVALLLMRIIISRH